MDKIENCKWRICDRLGNDSLTTCYCTHPKMHFKEGKEFIAVNCDHTAECHRFEPKPVVATVLCPCVRGEPCPIHPKPDEGWGLTDRNPFANIPSDDGLDTCHTAWNKGFERATKLKEGESQARIEALIGQGIDAVYQPDRYDRPMITANTNYEAINMLCKNKLKLTKRTKGKLIFIPEATHTSKGGE